MSPQPPAKRPRIGAGYILLLVGLLLVLGYVIWAFKTSWSMGSGAHMSANGWVALVIGFVVTGLLGGGLMWLAFYSSRKGYDDNVGGEED